MLITVVSVKTAMGLENPDQDDPVIDPKVENAIMAAQSLISAYIGMSVEVPGDPSIYTLVRPGPFRSLNLPKWPVSQDEQFVIRVDDNELTIDTDYDVQYRNGVVMFTRQYAHTKKLEVEYYPGFDSFTVPADLKFALQNMSIAIYSLPPGGFGAAGAVGPLKSMTMFDAMSLSFDTTESGSSNTPEGLVSQWSYVLDQYSVKKYVMAGVS